MAFDCRSDRVSHARRGNLSSSERLAFEAHLRACDSCLLDVEIGADFDALDQPEWDDGARIERLAARLAASRRRPLRKPVLRVAALAACLLLVTGIAAAAVRWLAPRPVLRVAANTASSNGSPSAKPAAAAIPLPSAPLPPEAPSPSAAASGLSSDVTAPALGVRTRVGLSAAQLFRTANEARRAGQSQKAIQLYGSLQQEYPGSAEAAQSTVSLGSLLSSANPRGALVQFDRYLSTAPRGSSAAEALYGRGRALQALGRQSDERMTWQELLARFPRCPYVDRATRRLAELR
ncbi:MAG: outer membrane protein assembly factor BamD [Myxococcales bacterium]